MIKLTEHLCEVERPPTLLLWKYLNLILFYLNIFVEKFVYWYQFGAYNEAFNLARKLFVFWILLRKYPIFWLKSQNIFKLCVYYVSCACIRSRHASKRHSSSALCQFKIKMFSKLKPIATTLKLWFTHTTQLCCTGDDFVWCSFYTAQY